MSDEQKPYVWSENFWAELLALAIVVTVLGVLVYAFLDTNAPAPRELPPVYDGPETQVCSVIGPVIMGQPEYLFKCAMVTSVCYVTRAENKPVSAMSCFPATQPLPEVAENAS